MTVLFFGKAGCAKCESTKRKLNHLFEKWQLRDNVQLVEYDLDTVDGLAEASFNDVVATPVVIINNDAEHLARWDGVIPQSDDLERFLRG